MTRFRKSLGKNFGPIRSRFALGGGFKVSDLTTANLILDLDPTLATLDTKHDQTGVVPGDTDPIGYFSDVLLNHMKQSSDAARPQLNVADSDFNGKNSIVFDGTDDFMITDTAPPLIAKINSGNPITDPVFSIVSVLKRSVADPTQSGTILSVTQYTSSGDYISVSHSTHDTGRENTTVNDGATVATAYIQGMLTTPYISLITSTGTVGELRRNGGVNLRTAGDTNSGVLGTLSRVGIGALVRSTVVSFLNSEAKFARLLMYNGDISGDPLIDALHNHLGSLYGITVTPVS